MDKRILFLVGLFLTFMASGQNPNYKLIEDFEYNSYANFKQQTDGISFLFNQLEIEDANGNSHIDGYEQIRFPALLVNSMTQNSFLQVRFRKSGNPDGNQQYYRRSELTQDTFAPPGGNQYIKSGDEFWYSFKINLEQFLFEPNNSSCYINGVLTDNSDVVSQIRMGNWLSNQIGGITLSPIFDIAVVNDKWKVFYDDFSIGNGQNMSEELQGTVAKNIWIEFKVNMKIAKDATGFIKVWQDGTKVFEKLNFQNAPDSLPNGDPIKSQLFYEFKFGVYKAHVISCNSMMIPNDPLTDRIIYFDDVWLGDYDYSQGLRLIEDECGKIVGMDDPTIHLIDVPRENDYKVLLRNLNTSQDVYFDSSTPEINLMEVLPANLDKNANYQINARIPGHPLFNNYSTNTICKYFETKDLDLRITEEDCNNNNPADISINNPVLNIYDVPRNANYTILLRNMYNLQDVYFSSNTAALDLIAINPANLESNTDYQINARIPGHQLFNNYTSSTDCRYFSTGNIGSGNGGFGKSGITDSQKEIDTGVLFQDGSLQVTETLEYLLIYNFSGQLILEEFNPDQGSEWLLDSLKRGFYILKTNLGTKKIAIN